MVKSRILTHSLSVATALPPAIRTFYIDTPSDFKNVRGFYVIRNSGTLNLKPMLMKQKLLIFQQNLLKNQQILLLNQQILLLKQQKQLVIKLKIMKGRNQNQLKWKM